MKINPDDIYDHFQNPPSTGSLWPAQCYLNKKQEAMCSDMLKNDPRECITMYQPPQPMNCHAMEDVRIIVPGIGVVTRKGYEWINMAAKADRLEQAIRQLASDHPDTAVSWPCNGHTCYQDIHDWASYVLYGGKGDLE